MKICLNMVLDTYVEHPKNLNTNLIGSQKLHWKRD
jgi:hypothetical protein